MTYQTSELTSSSRVETRLATAWQSELPDEGVLRRLLVTTDGSSTADGALRLADLLAQRGDISVAVLSVLDHAASIAERLSADALVEQVEQRLARMRQRINAVIGARPTWRTAIDVGPTVGSICRVADAWGSDLIIMGPGTDGQWRDVAPCETLRGIATISSTPMLFVPAHARVLPTHVMLATDFSRSGVRAARAALRVMRTPGVAHLVYVNATKRSPWEPFAPDPTYIAGVDAFFEAVECDLCPPPGIAFERAVVQGGNPASELLRYAAANQVELIATGSHSEAIHDRFGLGSVSAAIVRDARCAVLVSGGEP